jgi:hypothetical protein
MIFTDLEAHLQQIGLSTGELTASGQSFMVIKDVPINRGSHEGQHCEVALLRSNDNPWLPEAKLHVRPHLTPMGQNFSQPSPLGADWQYLSRRFDRPPTPRSFYAHILKVLGEL